MPAFLAIVRYRKCEIMLVVEKGGGKYVLTWQYEDK